MAIPSKFLLYHRHGRLASVVRRLTFVYYPPGRAKPEAQYVAILHHEEHDVGAL